MQPSAHLPAQALLIASRVYRGKELAWIVHLSFGISVAASQADGLGLLVTIPKRAHQRSFTASGALPYRVHVMSRHCK